MTSENLDWVAEEAGDSERTSEIGERPPTVRKKQLSLQKHLAFPSGFKKYMNAGTMSFEEMQIRNNVE